MDNDKKNHNTDIDGSWLKFVAFLKKDCCRITRSRETIFKHILSRKDHFLADEVATDLSSGNDKVSRATVYNTLKLMVEAGYLRQIRDSDTHTHYEVAHPGKQHDHMICDNCGAFIEFAAPELEKIIKKACRNMDFTLRNHRVAVTGVCSECRRNISKS